jgi:hypothetical protein
LKRIGKTLIVAASLLLAACSANEEGKAKELVTEFYQTHASNRPSGALTLKELITFRRFLSVPLFDLLKDVSVAQEARARSPRPKWRPILMPIPCRRWCKVTLHGHPNGASTFRVLQCEAQEREASCSVELIYSDAKLQSPAKWTDKILMTRDARGWIIDNIQYAGGNAPMRSGTLQDAMRTLLKRDAAPMVPLAPAAPLRQPNEDRPATGLSGAAQQVEIIRLHHPACPWRGGKDGTRLYNRAIPLEAVRDVQSHLPLARLRNLWRRAAPRPPGAVRRRAHRCRAQRDRRAHHAVLQAGPDYLPDPHPA